MNTTPTPDQRHASDPALFAVYTAELTPSRMFDYWIERIQTLERALYAVRVMRLMHRRGPAIHSALGEAEMALEHRLAALLDLAEQAQHLADVKAAAEVPA